MLIRGPMLALAMVVCVWFGLGIRQTRDLRGATAIVSRAAPPSPAVAAQAGSLLSSAGKLNPDSAVDVVRGRLALAQSDSSRAQQILARVVRGEPDNLQAWVALAQAVLHGSPAQLRVAVVNIARLDPRIK